MQLCRSETRAFIVRVPEHITEASTRESALWVDTLLEQVTPTTRPDRSQIVTDVAKLPPEAQIGILRECVRRMPALRSQDYRSASFAAGSVLYDVACHLYTRRLPYEESDVCALLESSRHACGHGSDVTPPLDIAHAYMQRHGFSERIAAAMRQFLETLDGVGSAQANFGRRRAAILLLADPMEAANAESGWSAHFRKTLRGLPDAERAAWQRFVLAMTANDIYIAPATWRKPAARLLSALGPEVVLQRIDEWTAVEDQPKQLTVRTGGSHLLKQFIWLLDSIAADDARQPQCDALVKRLVRSDWRPKERAAKFMIAAGYYLSRRPPAVAWDSLGELARWNGERPGKIREIVQQYAADHQRNATRFLAACHAEEPERRVPARPAAGAAADLTTVRPADGPLSGVPAARSLLKRWSAKLLHWRTRRA